MTPWIIVALVLFLAVITVFVVRSSFERVGVATPAELNARALDEGMIVGDIVPISSTEDIGIVPIIPTEHVEPIRDVGPERATHRPIVRWSKRFESSGVALDDATRLSLLSDLGIVRAPWGVPLLTQAYEEEPASEHRRAALRALAAYRHPDTEGTFAIALHAEDEEERAIASAAISALRIRAALPS